MNHRARIPALLLALALLLGCAGCGGGREPVTVTIWHVYGGETESPLNDLIDTFNETVGREQIAVILMEYTDRILNIKRTWTPADLSGFPDAASVSDWAKDAMADAVGLGLISGASNGGQTYLNPQGSATREQVATILMEFCKNVKK